ncbi:MAG: ABC transporter substrate-binding protein [Microbacterium sp.]
MRRRISAIAATASLALLLAACSTSDGGSTDGATDGAASGDPINLTILYGITGAYAGTGSNYMKGFTAAIDYANANGGAGGRPINVTLIDDESDNTVAVTKLNEALTSSTPPDIVIPGGVSTETGAMLPTVSDEGIFTLSVASSSEYDDPSKYPNHFGISSPQATQLGSIGTLMKADDIKTLGVLAGADAFGDANVEGITTVAADAGITIVDTERPDPNALNFDVEFQRLVAANPDAIYVDFAGVDQISRALSSRLTAGATDIPYYAGTASASQVPNSLASASALPLCYLPEFTSMVQQSTEPEYLQPLLDAFEGSDVSLYSGALGFDTARVLIFALNQTNGDTDATKLTAALQTTPIPADYLSLYPDGFSYSATEHYPTPEPNIFEAIPCDSTISNGLWVPSS